MKRTNLKIKKRLTKQAKVINKKIKNNLHNNQLINHKKEKIIEVETKQD